MTVATGKFSAYVDGLDLAEPTVGDVLPGLFGGEAGKASVDQFLARTGRKNFAAPGYFLNDFAEQSDGKIVMCGAVNSHVTNGFGLARMSAAGDLDTTFGPDGTGFVATTFVSNSNAEECITHFVLDDDSIIGVGFIQRTSPVLFQVCLAKYTSDGILDTTWGTGGKVVQTLGASNVGFMQSAAVDSSGRYVLVGFDSTGGFLVRFNANGSLDTTFGSGGIVHNTNIYAYRNLLIQSDGKILACGHTATTAAIICRYNSDGTLDTAGWGTAGTVSQTFSGLTFDSFVEGYSGLVIQSSGKICAFGIGYNSGGDQRHFIGARYSTAGVLDTTFASSGKTDLTLSYNHGFGTGYPLNTPILVDGDAMLILCSSYISGTAISGLFRIPGLLKILKDGAVDPSWGGDGTGFLKLNINGDGDVGLAVTKVFGNRLLLGLTRQTVGTYRWVALAVTKYGDIDRSFGDVV